MFGPRLPTFGTGSVTMAVIPGARLTVPEVVEQRREHVNPCDATRRDVGDRVSADASVIAAGCLAEGSDGRRWTRRGSATPRLPISTYPNSS